MRHFCRRMAKRNLVIWLSLADIVEYWKLDCDSRGNSSTFEWLVTTRVLLSGLDEGEVFG